MMKTYSPQQLSYQLSLYLDGALSEPEQMELEEYIAAHPETKKELEELRVLQKLFAQRKKLKEDSAFWTRVSTTIQEAKTEHENLLPFPRRFMPFAVALSAIVITIGGLVVFQKRAEVSQFISEKTKIVQKAYEQDVLKGSILPLFSDVDKNQVLNFALFGTLPLDAKSGTALQVDERAEKGYRIELRKRSAPKKTVTVKDLERDVQLTDAQTKVIDSMLAVMKKRIESSVLVTDNDALVIDPELPRLNRIMVGNIAGFLEPSQRVRFSRFLEKQNAQYAVKAHPMPRVRPEEMFVNIHRPRRSEQFVIVTPDTVVVSEVNIDVDSIQQYFTHEVHRVTAMKARTDRLIRRLVERQAFDLPRFQVIPKSLQIYGDTDALNIEIDRDLAPPDASPIQVEIRSRNQRIPRRSAPPMQGFGYRFYAPLDEEGMESLMVKIFNERGSFDTAFSYTPGQFLKRYPPKLDSLLRSMEKKRLQEAKRAREVDQ